MAAAARDYQKELLAQEKAQASSSVNQEVDLDELMDDPELEKLHADRIAALRKEAEKRQELKMQGHGEYREITEADFLGEDTGSDKVICHFYHREFYRCKMLLSLLLSLESKHCHASYCSEKESQQIGWWGFKTWEGKMISVQGPSRFSC
ncbi:hypothetical protein CDL12_11544 [Handroanthus impetiginosus]|uniref:Thioredoxin domain-containing protein n=1 Tax=Handroanthus impetiginosus TaxID=429701 RepID=A0A2G9HE35_9LAMI|nr:hypothetical protein CDL12_11544 [Handroanthus impetiginosus]